MKKVFQKIRQQEKINNLEEEIRWPLEMHPSLQGEVSFIMIGSCVGSLARWVIIASSANTKQAPTAQSHIKSQHNNWGD